MALSILITWHRARESSAVKCVFEDGLTTEQIMAVGKQVKAIPNLKHLEFVNKEQAMKEFKERLGDQQQLVNALGGVNPLPNSYVLTFENPEMLNLQLN